MLIVGLTGGIGSGKSTVANVFAELGAPIIDADKIAREITQPNAPALMDIIDHFEEQLLLSDGSLDRTKLRNIIFENPDQRQWLEELLHPLIKVEIENRLNTIKAAYVIIVIPLLLEVEPYPFINRILVIDTPETLQISRVTSRDHTTPTHVKAIMSTQMSRTLRLSQANDVIKNDGALTDLKSQVERLHNSYMNLAK